MNGPPAVTAELRAMASTLLSWSRMGAQAWLNENPALAKRFTAVITELGPSGRGEVSERLDAALLEDLTSALWSMRGGNIDHVLDRITDAGRQTMHAFVAATLAQHPS